MKTTLRSSLEVAGLMASQAWVPRLESEEMRCRVGLTGGQCRERGMAVWEKAPGLRVQ